MNKGRRLAVRYWVPALQYVPIEHRTYDLCLEAVREDKIALWLVPEEYKERIKKELEHDRYTRTNS